MTIVDLFPNSHPVTHNWIEKFVETVEAAPQPFTIDDIWVQAGKPYGKGAAVRRVVDELFDHGLIEMAGIGSYNRTQYRRVA